MTTSPFLSAMRDGIRLTGVWQNLPGTPAAEIAAAAGFSWVLLDQEHAPRSLEALVASVNAAERHGAHVIVRPGGHDTHEIGRILDLGVRTLLVPMVESAEQASAIAAACEFAPAGVRGVSGQTRAGGWGTVPDFLASARDEICLIAQIESAEGVRNAAEIISTPGVDAIFIGMADLAASMGHLGNPQHPDVVAAAASVADLATRAGLPLGTLVRGADAATTAFDAGYAFVGVGTDSALLATALRSLSAAVTTETK